MSVLRFDFDALCVEYGPVKATEIVCEHRDAEEVRALLDRAAARAVEWGMERWGDGEAGYLIEYFIDRISEHRGSDLIQPRAIKAAARGPKALTTTECLAVFAKNGYACQRCGTRNDLTVDHIHPVSKGGTNDPKNLQTLCKRCNSGKRDRV